jgi:hypothetical protein
VFAAEGEFHLAVEHSEHFLEVVAVGRRATAGGTCMSMRVYRPAVSSPVSRIV